MKTKDFNFKKVGGGTTTKSRRTFIDDFLRFSLLPCPTSRTSASCEVCQCTDNWFLMVQICCFRGEFLHFIRFALNRKSSSKFFSRITQSFFAIFSTKKMDVIDKRRVLNSVFRLAVQSAMPDVTLRHWLRKSKSADAENTFDLSVGDQVYFYYAVRSFPFKSFKYLLQRRKEGFQACLFLLYIFHAIHAVHVLVLNLLLLNISFCDCRKLSFKTKVWALGV